MGIVITSEFCKLLGRADWVWDEDLGIHIPSCSKYIHDHRCGNGPLIDDQIERGDCDEHNLIGDGDSDS
jgi:hypothetical protein